MYRWRKELLLHITIVKGPTSTDLGKIRPVLQRNSFWPHPENIPLCQIHDNDYSIRQDAISKVIRAREYAKNEQESEVRKFITPKIDFNSSSYYTMVEYGKMSHLQLY